MSDILHVEWTIHPKTPPRPILSCSGCGKQQPFRSSGRIRLNANGKRLDAWLIYKCVACDNTWNRPIFERRAVRSLDPREIEALEASTPAFVTRLEFDMQALRTKAGRIEEDVEIEVRKRAISAPENWRRIGISLVLPVPCAVRLDRLLSGELRLSRSRLQALQASGALRTEPERKDALKHAARHGTRIILSLDDKAERIVAGRAADGC